MTITAQTNKLVIDSAGTETKLPMKDWVVIGVFAPTDEGKEFGKTL